MRDIREEATEEIEENEVVFSDPHLRIKKIDRLIIIISPIIGILSAILIYFAFGIDGNLKILISFNMTLGFLPLIFKIANLLFGDE